MKADIDKSGYLVVIPETYIEYYALQYCYPTAANSQKSFIVDVSLVSGALIKESNNDK